MNNPAKRSTTIARMKPLIRVLHVEDSRTDATLIKGMLGMAKNHTFELSTVPSIAKATEEIDQKQFDVVLLDLEIEDSSGISTVEQVTAVAPNIPIVITTGHESPYLIQTALRKGAQDYLIKGKIGSDILNRTIYNAIDRKAAESEFNNKSLILNAVIDAAQLGYWDWNIKENSEYISNEACRMFGYTQNELMRRVNAWHDIVHPADLPLLVSAFKEHIGFKGSAPIDTRLRIKHKNGYMVSVLCRGKVIEWNDTNQAVRMAGCFIHIKE